MEGRAFASIATYLFLSSSIFGIRTNAGTWVSLQWAKVKIIQSQLAGLVGLIFVALGTWLTPTLGKEIVWKEIQDPFYFTIFNVGPPKNSPIIKSTFED